jgi:hypothetical protein
MIQSEGEEPMKRILVLGLTAAMSVALVPSALGAKAKPLKVKTNGWYVFDGVGSASSTPKGGTYSRCTNSQPAVIALGARYSVLNRSAPKGTKYILNGPNGIHFADTSTAKLKPGKYYHNFRASSLGQSSLPPGTYKFKLKVKGKTLGSMAITLVDDATC